MTSESAYLSESSASLESQLYAARSLIATGQTDEAADILQSLPQEDLNVRVVTLLNEYVAMQDSVADELREIISEYEASVQSQEGIVRSVAGTILQLEGETSEALTVLGAGCRAQDQECVALQVQILLSMNRIDAAKHVYEQAKLWMEDSVVSQLCEAWIGLQTGGEAYQSAFYVFDEIAQLPSANNVVVLNGKAVAQACMGHWPEAEAALAEATQVNPQYSHTLANSTAIAVPSGKPSTAEAALSKLKSLSSNHAFLEDLAHKSGLFDEAASKFVSAAAA